MAGKDKYRVTVVWWEKQRETQLFHEIPSDWIKEILDNETAMTVSIETL